jgi:hypothetical protein
MVVSPTMASKTNIQVNQITLLKEVIYNNLSTLLNPTIPPPIHPLHTNNKDTGLPLINNLMGNKPHLLIHHQDNTPNSLPIAADNLSILHKDNPNMVRTALADLPVQASKAPAKSDQTARKALAQPSSAAPQAVSQAMNSVAEL